MIISGRRLACLDPQGVTWPPEFGQEFDLLKLIDEKSNLISPLNGLAGFESTLVVNENGYNYTILRLPLRTTFDDSKLSKNLYNTDKMHKLLDALRKEAKHLLLFLKSVIRIEVHHISKESISSLSFCVEIGDKENIPVQRNQFFKKLEAAHNSRAFRISEVISGSIQFSVLVTDRSHEDNQSSKSEWLTVNYVGTSDHTVLEYAEKLHTFPLVGTALELGKQSEGRVFSLLPLPIEALSGLRLPVHVNGTFGLTDDRRGLRWPDIERKNDDSADWNKLIVRKLLPQCYAKLLLEARQYYDCNKEEFYKLWPDVHSVSETEFSELLQPLFTCLLNEEIFWTDTKKTWISQDEAFFIAQYESEIVEPILTKVLSRYEVNIVKIPTAVWETIELIEFRTKQITPSIAHDQICLDPKGYSDLSQPEKIELLKYFLSNDSFQSLRELYLLPLADGNFSRFTEPTSETVYLCSSDCPRYLLPSLDHLLVDHQELFESLKKVAVSETTNLRLLSASHIAGLLPHIVSSEEVQLPNEVITLDWLRKFWNWLSLESNEEYFTLFEEKFLIPIYKSAANNHENFHLIKLDKKQPAVYIGSSTYCSEVLLSALYKIKIKICLQSDFRFVQHPKLTSYLKQYDATGVLDAIIASQPNLACLVFTIKEAEILRSLFTAISVTTLNEERKAVLKQLAIFKSATCSTKLFSCLSAASESITKKALGEPKNSWLAEHLPQNLILLSRDQLKILQTLDIAFTTDVSILISYVFPLIRDGKFPSDLIEPVMKYVLDSFYALNSEDENLTQQIRDLPFIKLTSGLYSAPKEVFDSCSSIIEALYEGQDVFPHAPFNTPQRIQALRDCGLRTSVSPQELLDIIFSISSEAASEPQHVSALQLRRAKAVLKYISEPTFQSSLSGQYVLPDGQDEHTFSDALLHLSRQRCWLPVLSDKPPDYPDQLSWKGSKYTSHFISLSESVLVLSKPDSSSLPLLVGTRMYVVEADIPDLQNIPPGAVTLNSIAQFRDVIESKNEFNSKQLDSIVICFYSYMNDQDLSRLEEFKTLDNWIYIKRHNRFVSPSVVALKQNPSFRQNVEPYVYILPDRYLEYTSLFQMPRIADTVSDTHLLFVLKDIGTGVDERLDSHTAWEIVESILNWLTEDGTKAYTPPSGMVMYAPVETESGWPLMEEVSNVVYVDIDFIQEHMDLLEDYQTHSCKYLHADISSKLAQHLGTKPLSECFDISKDTFEDAGQQEPVFVRLKNILRDYKAEDGLTVIKELLQNADDAKATEVNICYDTRKHETDPKKLFFPGMAKAHGPALIVHNNSTFSDLDFENITKLARSTKQEDIKALKIGKFGVGFCSSYHISDVPSFISRDKLYIFDPTLSYLKDEIKDPTKPGKKITFTHKFISHSAQLSPFDGLFEFNRTEYNGTIFRFPFRTHPSELSETCYTKRTIDDLVSAIEECSSNLLLFLQHVKTITFHQYDEDQMTLILKISRNDVPLPLPPLSKPEIRKMSCESKEKGESCFKWLVVQENQTNLNEYFTGSVACPLYGPDITCKVDASFKGELFCFLPLSLNTGLPVHISSNFAVLSNRRGVWTSDDHGCQDTDVQWNITLINGVIPQAYHSLLCALKQMGKNGLLQDYIFYCLWPLKSTLLHKNPWNQMIDKLYAFICTENSLFYSDCNKVWINVSESKFLEPGILCLQSEKQKYLECVFIISRRLNLPIVDLTEDYRSMLQGKLFVVDENGFLNEVFENLTKLESISNQRSEIIRRMLEIYTIESEEKTERSRSMKSFLMNHACIPCAPDGKSVKRCNEVINPKATFYELFDEAEGYFPVAEIMEKSLAVNTLLSFGMISEKMPWKMLLERAQSIQEIFKSDHTKALKRVKLIMNSKIEGDAPEEGKMLASLPFLPVKQDPPSIYPLSWKGKYSDSLDCGQNLLTTKHINSDNSLLCGSTALFVCESEPEEGGCGHIPPAMLTFLNIKSLPMVEDVLTHFKELITYVQTGANLSAEITDWITSACKSIYTFLNDRLQKVSTSTSKEYEEVQPLQKVLLQISSITSLPCIWTEKEFIETKVVFKDWAISGPYIYPIPQSLNGLESLISALGIKDKLGFEDVQNVLQKMKNDFKDKPVSGECEKLLKTLVSPLLNLTKESISGDIALPGKNYVMYSSRELYYDDVPWTNVRNTVYVNKIIPRDLAEKLGVSPVRSKMLEGFVGPNSFEGVPFGQREQLMQRIQNILQGYPFDITVLKELLQNADDAKATKMFVILDKRTHGTDSVLSENWAELQGPAILVWNDKEFSEKDLTGIQKLGMGSKRSDSETIGQYGIGFNAVYHLTDCPSFISGGEIMCVLDPHCRYVYGATAERPGMRYNHLTQNGFWNKFPDMKASFLQENLTDAPDFSTGTLFRFPLRSTQELVEQSKILDHSITGIVESKSKVLTAEKMDQKLNSWAPQLKHALLFLSNISELHFFTIEEESSTLSTLKHFSSSLQETARESIEQLLLGVSTFNRETGDDPFVVKYPLAVREITHYSETTEHKEEKWIIQQGIGDLSNKQQTWKYIKTVKPRHGIAAPLNVKEFEGQVFCFLPLPLKSKLPVHINGSFILHSDRRTLWKPSESKDSKSEWNDSILEAIASSYAQLLNDSPKDYGMSDSFGHYQDAEDALSKYYKIFPSAYSSDLDTLFLRVGICVYKNLIRDNCLVFGVITTSPQERKPGKMCYNVEWHPINSTNPLTQVYFSKGSTKDVILILENLGMKLTRAPSRIHGYLNIVLAEMPEVKKIEKISSETVFSYYVRASKQTRFPAELKETAFKTVENFKVFLQYILQPSKENSKVNIFPKSPFGYPFLLTADEEIREFSQKNKVVCSTYYFLFPNSLDKFLHPAMLDMSMDSELFVCMKSINTTLVSEEMEIELKVCMPDYSLIKSILANELPLNLQGPKGCSDYEDHISKERLRSFWECLVKDRTFAFFSSALVQHLALLPATNDCLYSTKCDITPAYPPGLEPVRPHDMQLSITQSVQLAIYNTLSELGFPFLDTNLLCKASINACPTLFNITIILKFLCHLHKKKDLGKHFSEDVVQTMISYFKAIDFKNDPNSSALIKSLPLFESIDGNFNSLEGKKYFEWTRRMCSVGFQKWSKLGKKELAVVFLKPKADWGLLGSADQLGIEKLSAEQIYIDYVFPMFPNLTEFERYKHLEHIKNRLIGSNKLIVSNPHDQLYAVACSFLKDLSECQCICEHPGETPKPVKYFCDHRVKVFLTFKKKFHFLPETFTDLEKDIAETWLDFFIDIGLKVYLSTDEYLELCEEVSQKINLPNDVLRKHSKVLVEYLFSDDTRENLRWYQNSTFLQNLANIPFLFTEILKEYKWIHSVANPSSGKHLSKPKDAALLDQAVLLWTVKPVIKLPGFKPYMEWKQDTQLLQQLGITVIPTVSDVIKNIDNICSSSEYANQKLFQTYSQELRAPPETEDLISIMSHQFEFS